MKKILVAIRREQGGSYHEPMVNRYLTNVQAKGYTVEMLDDPTGDVQRFLEEIPLMGDLSPLQKDVLENIHEYEYAVYVPARATEFKDALVYRVHAVADYMTDQIVTKAVERPDDSLPDSATEQDIRSTDAREQPRFVEAFVGVEEQSDAVDENNVLQNSADTSTNDTAYYFSQEQSLQAHPIAQEEISTADSTEYLMPSEEIRENEKRAIQRISLEELQKLTEASGELAKNAEETAIETIQEQPKSKGLSAMRRIRLVFPWIVMLLMTYLGYQSVAWLPFVLATFGLLVTGFSKKYKHLDKTPEWLSVFIAIVALGVSLIHFKWMAAIAMPISLMAIALFLLVSFVHWDS